MYVLNEDEIVMVDGGGENHPTSPNYPKTPDSIINSGKMEPDMRVLETVLNKPGIYSKNSVENMMGGNWGPSGGWGNYGTTPVGGINAGPGMSSMPAGSIASQY